MTDTAEAQAPPKPKKRKKITERGEELSGRPEIKEKLDKVFEAVSKGFNDQADRADQNMDHWDCYNCELSRYQNYTGNMSQIFLPIVRNAVDALVTRYINQAFPQSGRHVEAVTGEEDQPYAILSLIEHYIEKAQLQTGAIEAILRNGQIEGQYNAYIDWDKVERFVVSRETKPMKGDGDLEHPELGTVETIVEEEISEECPGIEALHDNDVAVLPATAPTVTEAIERGGSYTVIRRWTKAEVERMVDEEDITETAGDKLLADLGKDIDVRNTEKALAHAAGIHVSDKTNVYYAYETWTKLPVDGRDRLCKVLFGGDKLVLSAKLNPYWSDRCPGLSAPVKKLPGVLKGEAPVAACMGLQIQANDAANEAGHMLYYALAPVLAVNPQMVTKWRELVSDVAAVWPVDPNGVKLLEWPSKIREALEVIMFNQTVIFTTLGVNPAILPQQTGKTQKRNQAEIALEQQVDILQTAGAVTVLQQQILSPAMQMWAEMDHQFREKGILVREFGELGMMANMERIEPIQMGNRWRLRWSGVEQARNAAMVQQQIGWFGTVAKIPPQQYMGYRLDAAPLIEHSAGQVFPARLARLVFKSLKDELGIEPEVENQMIAQGFEVQTHAADNDQKHIQIHMQAPAGPARDAHIKRHQLALGMKQAAMAAQGQQGNPQAGRGPRPGAVPAGPKRPQQPAGAIHPDRMPAAGAVVQPRKT